MTNVCYLMKFLFAKIYHNFIALSIMYVRKVLQKIINSSILINNTIFYGSGIVQLNSSKKWLRILFALGCLIIITIICVLTFVFDVSADNKKQERIALLLIDDANNEVWENEQYNNMKNICLEVGAVFLYRKNPAENAIKFKDTISDLVNEGAGMIFVSTPTYALPREYFAEQYPNVAFATNTADYKERNLTPYLIRMYQGRWLAGALAGMKTKTNVIGYVAPTPDSPTYLEVNAFTLGVQETNPKAKVITAWVGSWQGGEIATALTQRLVEEKDVDVITYHLNDDTVAEAAESFDVDYIGYNYAPATLHRLTSVMCRYDLYYRDIINHYLKGELNHEGDHWMDIRSGAVILSNYSEAVTPDVQNKVEELRQELLHGRNIFSGDIYDNEGLQRCSDGSTISDRALLFRSDWLVRGVEVLE